MSLPISGEGGQARFDFTGSRVIVTGASRGIGRGIAEAFARAGAGISICARNPRKLEETREALAAHGGPVHAAICDVADGDQVAAYVAGAAAALGGVDVLVSNVSAFARSDAEESWLAGVQTDLLGAVRLSHAALPWLERAPGGGVIVHVNSITALRPSRSAPAYAAMKAALMNYTGSQALALLGRGVRVNGVAPGSTEAPGHFWEKRRLSGDPAYAAALASQPTGRMGHPDDIAGVVLFLASDAARWVVGQTILADGGQLANGG
ncbi:SDR family oxidoreductase [Niveispirillum sp.]|uniref:SDR family NAD(P)-dependent oxidoreductase n=1 Tax=Niveispirillum sp. TaxID=1917217 RepID=UPI0025E9F3AA|nr:SDR family oxidoreductase [Niveispirillum sp.]